MERIGDKTYVPMVWLIIAIFVGGGVLVTVGMRWATIEAKASEHDKSIARVEVLQEQYNKDVRELHDSVIRIEAMLKETSQ